MYKVIEVAEAEVGYLEKASNKYLDDKTKNAGYSNFTKYARDLDSIKNFYNGKKNGFPWCDVFVDWCFVKAYGAETAKKMLYQPNSSLGAGCQYSANYFKAAGKFYAYPQVGDQIFFASGGEAYHTGLVYKVTNTTVYTIEGNTSGANGVVDNGGGVFKKSYSKTYYAIYGYGRPNYALVSASAAPETPEKKGDEFDVANLKTIQKGSEGSEVRSMQILLIGNGYSCGSWGADGDCGSATVSAIKKFQKANKLDADGICGPLTWSKLLGV